MPRTNPTKGMALRAVRELKAPKGRNARKGSIRYVNPMQPATKQRIISAVSYGINSKPAAVLGLCSFSTWKENFRMRRSIRPYWKDTKYRNVKTGQTSRRYRKNPRNVDVARAWVLGLEYFNSSDLDRVFRDQVTKYCRKVHSYLWSFRLCPPKGMLLRLMSLIISGEVRYLNLMGDYITACNTGDALLHTLVTNYSAKEVAELISPHPFASEEELFEAYLASLEARGLI